LVGEDVVGVKFFEGALHALGLWTAPFCKARILGKRGKTRAALGFYVIRGFVFFCAKHGLEITFEEEKAAGYMTVILGGLSWTRKVRDITALQRRTRELAKGEVEHGIAIMQRSELCAVCFVRSITLIQHISGEGSLSDSFAYLAPGYVLQNRPDCPLVISALGKPVNGLNDRERSLWEGVDHRISSRISGERREGSGLPRLSPRRAIPARIVRALGRGAKLSSAQRHHVVHGRAPLDDGEHVGAPGLQRRALFRGEVMALVNADNASPASRDMVKNLFRHFEAHAEPLQSRGGRAARQFLLS
jgi:hypothetical protein